MAQNISTQALEEQERNWVDGISLDLNFNAIKKYVLGQLGAPYICVELTNQQIQDTIGDCIRYWWQYANDGTHEDYLAFMLVPGMTKYKICQELDQVVNFECSNWLGDINQLFSPAHTLLYSDLMSMGGMQFSSTCRGPSSSYGDVLGNWNATLTWLEEAKNEFSTLYQVKYIKDEKTLSVWPTPKAKQLGLLHVYKRDKVSNIIQKPLFREMAVCKCGMVWANALRKYSLQIAGGGTLNADSLYSSYKDRYDAILERIYKENPNYDFIVG